MPSKQSSIRHIKGQSKKPQQIAKEKQLASRRVTDREIKPKPLLAICQKCQAVFYDKKWHTKTGLKNHLKNKTEVKKTGFAGWFAAQVKSEKVCPACKQKKDFSEGVVYLKNIPGNKKGEILRLIANIGQRADARDREDRVVKIEEKEKQITVYTSENQLALSIAKQVARAHKGGELEIKFSKNEEAVRVYWEYPS